MKMTIVLKNNLTKQIHKIKPLETYIYRYFYAFVICLDDKFDEGEYSYDLIDEYDNVVATGLLQIGDYKPKKVNYDNKQKPYITYKGNLN